MAQKKIVGLLCLALIIGSGLITKVSATFTPYEEYTAEIAKKVKGYGVETLFKSQHTLPQNREELSIVKKASSIALEKLNKGEGKAALPYLAFAEAHGDPKSIRLLSEIKSGMYDNISQEVKDAIAKSLPTNNIIQLSDSYISTWYANQERIWKENRSLFEKSIDFVSGIFHSAPKPPRAQPGITPLTLLPELPETPNSIETEDPFSYLLGDQRGEKKKLE